jgi:hypothetical protein
MAELEFFQYHFNYSKEIAGKHIIWLGKLNQGIWQLQHRCNAS